MFLLPLAIGLGAFLAFDSAFIFGSTLLLKIRKPLSSAIIASCLHLFLLVLMYGGMLVLGPLCVVGFALVVGFLPGPLQWLLTVVLMAGSIFIYLAPRAYAIMLVYDAEKGKSFLASLICAVVPTVVFFGMLLAGGAAALEFSNVLGKLKTMAVPTTLKPGDPAPPLVVSQWLNGEPVPSFQKGKVYVVECWATWCGPCRATIPHISELNTQFKNKDVVFIGLNVWEQDIPGVQPFINTMGSQMNYRVAVDSNGQSAKGWLTAAGRNSIPSAFVVGKDSNIAWIGDPRQNMDEAIRQAVLVDYRGAVQPADPVARNALARAREIVGGAEKDPEAESRAPAKPDNSQAKPVAAIPPVHNVEAPPPQEKAAEKAPAAVIPPVAPKVEAPKIDVVEIKTKPPESGAAPFRALWAQKDYPAAYKLAAALSEKELKDNADAQAEMSSIILDDEGVEKRDFDLALKLAARADELGHHANPAALDTLARAWFAKGDVDKAVELETLALVKAETVQMVKQCGERVTYFRQAPKPAAPPKTGDPKKATGPAASVAVSAVPNGAMTIAVYVLKDGRHIQAQKVVDGGDELSIKDMSGTFYIIPKKDIVEIQKE